MKKLLVCLLAILMVTPAAVAEELPTLITATGRAEIVLPIERAELVFTITATGDELEKAEKNAASSVSALQSALVAAGVKQADMQALRTDAQLLNEYHYSKLQEPALKTKGVTVAYTLTVQVGDAAHLPGLIDAAILCGEYAGYEVRYFSDAQADAITPATEDALAQAQAIAKALGLSTTRVAQVESTQSSENGAVEAVVKVTLEAKP